jgi:hypothetical protein
MPNYGFNQAPETLIFCGKQLLNDVDSNPRISCGMGNYCQEPLKLLMVKQYLNSANKMALPIVGNRI